MRVKRLEVILFLVHLV